MSVKGIEVEFRNGRSPYPVSVKVEIGDNETHRSKQYEKGENVHWLFEKQLSKALHITISVREHRRFRRTVNVMTIYVPLAKLVMKPLFVPDECSDGSILMKVHCGAGGPFIDIIRRLIEQSQVQLGTMKVFLERLRRACEILDYIASITEAVSAVHPSARSAAMVASRLFEYCRSLQDCHATASELIENVATFIPFTDFPSDGLKCEVTACTAEQMMKLFEKICRTIMTYSSTFVLGGFMGERTDEICDLKRKFQSLKETFSWCLTTEIWKTTLKIEVNTESLLLRLLNPVWDAYYNEGRACFDGSRKDTLRILEDWSASESSAKLMWIYGCPGLGKTAIAHSAAKMFDDQNRLAGCFFTDKEEKERQNPRRVIPTIAYQMAKWHGNYHANVLDVLRAREELGLFQDLNSQFEILIRRPIRKISTRYPPLHKPLIIVLDALDEIHDCLQSRRCLADYIVDFALLVPWLKVLVFSTRSKSIDAHFRRAKVKNLGLDDPSLDLRSDIEAYAMLCAQSKRASASWSPGLENDVRGLFSRISRSLKMLHATDGSDVFQSKTRIWDMGDFFRTLIQSVMERNGYRTDKVPVVRDIMAVLSCISSTKPPKEDVVVAFLQLFQPHLSEDMLRTIVFSLSPIVSRDAMAFVRILLPVPAFLDFISRERRSGCFYVDMDYMRQNLAKYCLDTMHEKLKFNICNISSPYLENRAIPNLEQRLQKHIPGIIQFSSLNWMDLISQSEEAQNFRDSVADLLCSRKALFWIEVLSLIGAVEKGIEILSKCADCFKEEARIVHVITELLDFLSKFKSPIEISAVHIYVSALLWLSPNSRLVRGISFRSRYPPRVMFEVSAILNPRAICTNSDGGITSIARSADGRKIVTGGKDGTLRIWDGKSGAQISEPIKAHTDEVHNVQYSPDGSKIVSGSLNGTVKIWDAEEGRLFVGPLRVYKSSWVLAVTYSPDGSRVVSGDFNGTLRIWNTRNGELIKESQSRHEENVSALAFSPNGERIASGSRDSTIRIWDAQNGIPVGNAFKWTGDHYARAVAYSPDGKRIISGHSDRMVRVWDAQTGVRLLEPLEGHKEEVVDVSYSRDGRKILSASRDESIRIWDATTGSPAGLIRRGESRWDSERRCFVSIPSWWPRNKLKIGSLIYSASLLDIRGDGWVRRLDGGLLLWVPPDHRCCSCHTTTDITSSTDDHDELLLKSQWRRFLRESDWSKIIDADGRTEPKCIQ
ncbi:hypothetical protein ACEPAF_14 [Sanghuangporus sanghuang]